MFKISGLVIIAVGGILGPLSANAGTIFDTSLATPGGTYYGSGNVNAGWTVSTEGDIELGLRAKNRFEFGDNSVINSDTNHYWVPTGVGSGANSNKAMWNFDFSIGMCQDTCSLQLSDITAQLTVTDMTNPLHPFVTVDPLSYWNDNAGWGYPNTPADPGYGFPAVIPDGSNRPGLKGLSTDPDGHIRVLGAQNSENPLFNLALFPGFDPSAGSHEYKIDLNVFQRGTLLASDSILIESAPEPASFVLFGAGLVLVGAYRRRKSMLS